MTENRRTPASASFKAFAQIIETSAKAGMDLLSSLYGGAPGALDGIVHWASGQAGSGSCCSCEIPPPCWMPRSLCEVVSYGKAGNTARITFVVTNNSMTTRLISIFTTTKTTGLVFSATHLTLGPMERGSVEVAYTIPTTLPSAHGREILLWIQGCKLHFLRWTIKLGPVSADTNYEVWVNDGSESVHHWYDHFYCPHPCLQDQRVSDR